MLATTQAGLPPSPAGTSGNFIGGAYPGNSSSSGGVIQNPPLNAWLRELLIYRRTLTAAEQSSLYSYLSAKYIRQKRAPPPPVPAPPVIGDVFVASPYHKFYLFSSQPVMAWLDCVSACKATGGAMAAFYSADERSAVLQFLSTRVPDGINCWVGLTDDEEEQAWVYVDNTPVMWPVGGAGYINWHDNNNKHNHNNVR